MAIGSFYMLVFMACTRMRPEFRKVEAEHMLRFSKALRCPPGELHIQSFLFEGLTPLKIQLLGD